MLIAGLTLIGGVTVTLIGVIFNGFSKDVEGVKNENKDIKENYITRFDKVNTKLDTIIEKLHEVDKKVESQARYCESVQKQRGY